MGEHDISSTSDGEKQDIKIVRAVRHPDYDKHDGTNDLAVLYLERDADLSREFIFNYSFNSLFGALYAQIRTIQYFFFVNLFLFRDIIFLPNLIRANHFVVGSIHSRYLALHRK